MILGDLIANLTCPVSFSVNICPLLHCSIYIGSLIKLKATQSLRNCEHLEKSNSRQKGASSGTIDLTIDLMCE